MVGSSWVNSVFVGDDFPELGTDLVTALTSLDVDDFSHFEGYLLLCVSKIFKIIFKSQSYSAILITTRP